jgi:hypothetical protein
MVNRHPGYIRRFIPFLRRHAALGQNTTDRQNRSQLINDTAEICVEVLSPNNSAEDVELKKRLYFEEAAQEVWICGLEGQMKFFSPTGELKASRLCRKFPKRILTSHERLDLEQQKEVAGKPPEAGRRSDERRTNQVENLQGRRVVSRK